MVVLRKRKFHYSKYPVNINNIGIDKVIVWNKVTVGKKGFKYSIGYKKDEKVKPLCIMFPKTSWYTKNVDDETKYISFFDKRRWVIVRVY